MSEATYYQRNKPVIPKRAKDYYENNKEVLKERAKNTTLTLTNTTLRNIYFK